MILFHIPGIDSGDLRLWRRTIVPAYLLRRAGVMAKIVVGDVPISDFAGASAIVLGGSISAISVKLSQGARAAGLRVILDIADTRPLTADVAAARSVAQTADMIIVGNDELAALAATRLGPQCPSRVIAGAAARGIDVLRALAMFPGIGIMLIADATRIRVIDAVRRLRHRMRQRRKAPAAAGPCIVWFGDGNGLNQEGGLAELMLAVGDLVDLSQDVSFRLRVVGTSRRLFRRTIGRLPIRTEFRRLTVPTLAHDLRGADLCFLPSGGDPASKARSAARAEIARGLGIPVLTVPHGGLAAMPHVTLTSEWRSALRSILAGQVARAEVPAVAETQAISEAWRGAVTAADLAVPATCSDNKPDRLRVMFLLQQFQDLDLICPVAEAACASPDLEVRVAILTKIAVPATRRLRVLRERGAELVFWHGRELVAGKMMIAPGDFDVAVTASDGSGPGARYASAFVRAANAAGAVTLNIQHGLDNSGLTFGPPPALHKTQFNAGFVLTWGDVERLTEAADPATRAKVIPVGCPKRHLRREDAADFPLAGRQFIAVFENLHWWRYDGEYRRRFVQDLIDSAIAAPDLVFLLKPHMGGRWFTKEQAGRRLPPNLIAADPGAPQWRRFTADSFLAHAAGVITTPSTIALDAARYDLPTALVAYGIEAENYAPLFRIEQGEDWRAFVQQARTGSHDMTNVRTFRDAVVVPGDAVARILDVIRLAASGGSQTEILTGLAREGHTAPA